MKVIGFDIAVKALAVKTVPRKPVVSVGKNGVHLNRHIQDAVVRRWLTPNGSMWQIAKDPRKEYGPRVGMATVERILKENVRMNVAA